MGIANGYGGLQPRTRMPYQQYKAKDHFDFDEWWENQEFKVVGATFNRKSLITTIANKEGGAHVDSEVDARIAGINRTASPYTLIDGEETFPMYVLSWLLFALLGRKYYFH